MLSSLCAREDSILTESVTNRFGVSSPQYFRILKYENIGWLLPGLACRIATWLRLTKRKTRDAGLVFIAVLCAGEDSNLRSP